MFIYYYICSTILIENLLLVNINYLYGNSKYTYLYYQSSQRYL
ncbi:MAG: hypothetical protein RI947_533 [Candidatus Parcubacteria bacterium]|jgi:hypothetical protein